MKNVTRISLLADSYEGPDIVFDAGVPNISEPPAIMAENPNRAELKAK